MTDSQGQEFEQVEQERIPIPKWLKDIVAADPEKKVIVEERLAALEEILSRLTPKDRKIIEMRFGFHDKEGRFATTQEIGKEIGKHRSTISADIARIISQLKGLAQTKPALGNRGDLSELE